MLHDTDRLARTGITELDRHLAALAERADHAVAAIDGDAEPDEARRHVDHFVTAARVYLAREQDALAGAEAGIDWLRYSYLVGILEDLKWESTQLRPDASELVRLLDLWVREQATCRPRRVVADGPVKTIPNG